MRASPSSVQAAGFVGAAALMVATATTGVAVAAEPTGAVADVLSCSRLSDPAVRLACFESAAAALQRSYSPPAAPASSPPPAAATAPAPRQAPAPAAAPAAPPAPAAAFARPVPPPEPVERPPQVRRATGALQSLETGPDGRLLVTLADGSVWRQIDDRRLAKPPEPGTPTEVRKGVWGAYFIDFEGGREIRARRIR